MRLLILPADTSCARQHFLERVGDGVTVCVENHLTLQYENQIVRLRLDQGFGRRRAPNNACFEFGTTPARQAKVLADNSIFVSVSGQTHIVFLK